LKNQVIWLTGSEETRQTMDTFFPLGTVRNIEVGDNWGGHANSVKLRLCGFEKEKEQKLRKKSYSYLQSCHCVLSVSITHTNTHTNTEKHTDTNTHPQTTTHKHTPTNTHPQTHSLSLSQARAHTHTQTHTHTYSTTHSTHSPQLLSHSLYSQIPFLILHFFTLLFLSLNFSLSLTHFFSLARRNPHSQYTLLFYSLSSFITF